MMAGNITAICFGAMAAVIVSLCTRGRMTAEEVEAEWEKTRDIDNPLNPWVEVYKGKNISVIGLLLTRKNYWKSRKDLRKESTRDVTLQQGVENI